MTQRKSLQKQKEGIQKDLTKLIKEKESDQDHFKLEMQKVKDEYE